MSNHSNASSKPAVDPRHTKFLEGKFVTVLLLLLQKVFCFSKYWLYNVLQYCLVQN